MLRFVLTALLLLIGTQCGFPVVARATNLAGFSPISDSGSVIVYPRPAADSLPWSFTVSAPGRSAAAETPPSSCGSECDPYPAPGTPPPTYPDDERKAGHEGVVRLNLCVDETGRATSVSVDSSSGFPALDQAALDWARNATWVPGKRAGKAAAVCFVQSYRFKLSSEVQTRLPTRPCVQNADRTSTGFCYPRPARGSGTPNYPREERRLGHRGTVVFYACIDKTGKMTRAEIRQSSGYQVLDDSVLKWVRRTRWLPATLDGVPIAACFAQAFHFSIP